eukprot:332194-Prymnesium_polylepis.2
MALRRSWDGPQTILGWPSDDPDGPQTTQSVSCTSASTKRRSVTCHIRTRGCHIGTMRVAHEGVISGCASTKRRGRPPEEGSGSGDGLG